MNLDLYWWIKMTKTKFWTYAVNSHYYKIEVHPQRNEAGNYVDVISHVQDMAEDYYNNHIISSEADEWTLTLMVWDHDENYLGKFTVEIELSPTFFAYRED